MFSEAFTLLPDERTSTSIQLAFSGGVLMLCRFVAVLSFFEGAALAKPSPSLIVAPPLFSRGLWLLLPSSHVYAMFLGPFRSLSSALKYKNKKGKRLNRVYPGRTTTYRGTHCIQTLHARTRPWHNTA